MTYLMGERIRLRAAERSDISTFLHWINDPEVTENLMLHYPISQVEEEHWFEQMLSTPVTEHVYVIERLLNRAEKSAKEIWQPIGTIQFHNINQRIRSAEIGIMIGEKSLWDQGYGTEAMRLMLKHGFNTVNLHRIWLQVYEKNQRGIRTYEKAGFTQEGRFRSGHYQYGRYHDIILMSILRPEWDEISTLERQVH